MPPRQSRITVMSCTFSNAITLATASVSSGFKTLARSACSKTTVLSSSKGRPLHPPGSHCTHISFQRKGGYSPKTAPAYDGTTSWFEYEQLIDDCCDITTLDAKKKGSPLKTRLSGLAALQQEALDREKLTAVNGVEYFKTCDPSV